MNISKVKLLITFSVIFLAGCGFALKNQINSVDLSEISTVPSKNKPVVFMDYTYYLGNPSKNIDDLPKPTISQSEFTFIHSILTESGLFKEVIYDEYDKGKAEYTLQIRVFLKANRSSIFGAVLTGLTLFLIPSSHDQDFIVEIKILDKNGNVIESASNNDGQTFWIGLFAPLFTDGVGDRRHQVISNQIKAALNTISNSTVFQ